ncbi:hypothetical protein DM50_3034 [Burkholderia mallei]|nr:hypothetical protein DM50_3034 [Burkholderia mallei]KOT21837.1 hypothetical protein DM52_1897 [Burkholderia mallei]
MSSCVIVALRCAQRSIPSNSVPLMFHSGSPAVSTASRWMCGSTSGGITSLPSASITSARGACGASTRAGCGVTLAIAPPSSTMLKRPLRLRSVALMSFIRTPVVAYPTSATRAARRMRSAENTDRRAIAPTASRSCAAGD